MPMELLIELKDDGGVEHAVEKIHEFSLPQQPSQRL